MPTPSVFNQGPRMTAVPTWSLQPSPRNYNSSIIEFEGRRLMAYRSHRMDQQGRCGIAMCELNDRWEGRRNHWLNLPEQVASVTVHHEDPRLFVFKGRLHVAFTETQFHPEPQPYTCVMKYARLKPRGKEWQIDRVYWPRYGDNDGSHQEKNWQFFEAQKGRLHAIYQAEPHVVIEIDGEDVVGESKSVGGTRWPWGAVRGGTPPIRLPNGRWLTIFHSATPYPVAPHWRRYYAGAYVFEAEAPYRIVAMSQRPLLTGSEADGHGYDPRKVSSWKPFVVFPSGIIPRKAGRGNPPAWWVSYGINDHATTIAEHVDLALGDPTFAGWGSRFFRTDNGSAIIKIFVREDQKPIHLKWDPAGQVVAGQRAGVLEVKDPKLALQLQEQHGVEEIDEAQYRKERA